MAPKQKCQNPLFLSFIEKIRNDAQEKGSKSYHAYSKAYNSVKVHPRPEQYPSGLQNCIGVGSGIIGQLTKMLKAHNESLGIQDAIMSPESSRNAKRGREGSPDSPAKKAKAPRELPSDDDDDLDNLPPKILAKQKKAAAAAAKPKVARAPKAKKMYVPEKGSGAYAILIAMYTSGPEERYVKNEIIDAAEAGGWSKTSFQRKSSTEHYTAWNGMKTLQTNGLVGQQGSKNASFWLTEDGTELARTLADDLDPGRREQDRPQHVASPVARPPASSQTVASSSQPARPRLSALAALDAAVGREEQSAGRRVAVDGVGARDVVRASAPASREPDKFGFFFVKRAGDERVLFRDDARKKPDASGGTLCRIEFRTSQRHHPIAKDNVTEIEPAPFGRDDGPPTSFGWAVYEDIGPRAVPFPSVASPAQASRPTNGGGSSRPITVGSSPPAAAAASGSRAVNVGHSRLVVPQGSARTLSAPSSMTGEPITSLLAAITESRASQPVASGSGSGASRYHSTPANAVAGPSVPRSVSASAARDPPRPVQSRPSNLSKRTQSSLFDKEENSHYAHHPFAGPDVDSLLPLVPGSSPAKVAAAADAFAIEPVVWPAGSFEIILLLDTREIGGKKDRSGFLDRLVNEGLEVEQEALPLGDIIWVARRIDGGGNPGEDQVVLDWVIERKRLDDLVSSITDGRFHEQKHRLGQSGVSNVIYLIEDYKIEQDIWAASVATAVSSTQVVDGFFVKRTQSLADSVAYLKAMHETIVELLRYDPLYIIPSTSVNRRTYLDLQRHLRANQPTQPHRTFYDAYKQLNSKSGSLILESLWAQMLLTITGLTPEKASAIIEIYPTPVSLWRAYKEADEEEEREVKRKGGEDGMRVGKGKKKWEWGDAGKMLLFSTVVAAEGSRRNIGKALSVKVWETIRSTEY